MAGGRDTTEVGVAKAATATSRDAFYSSKSRQRGLQHRIRL